MESDVVTLQDIFLAKPPEEDSPTAGRTLALLSPLVCTGLKPHFLEKMAASGVALPPTFFEQEDFVEHAPPSPPGTADELEAQAGRIRVGIASASRSPRCRPRTRGEGLGVDATSFPRIRMTVVASQPSVKPPALKENGNA